MPFGPDRWRDLTFGLLAVAYALAFGFVLWQHIHLPLHGDEAYYAQKLIDLREDGAFVAMARGDVVGYLGLVAAAGGFSSFVLAARGLSLLAAVLVAVMLARLGIDYGISVFARRLSMLALFNIYLAGHAFVVMGIADTVFTLIMLAALIALARAIGEGRMGLAAVGGALWGFCGIVRPLAPFYTLAIGCAIGLRLWRDRSRRAGLAAAVALATCGVCFAVEQSPALWSRGAFAFEHKEGEPGSTWAERQNLSRERLRPLTVKDWLWFRQIAWLEVARYKAEHGPDSIPKSRLAGLRHAPWAGVRDTLENIFGRTTFWIVGLLGLLAPALGWVRWPARSAERSRVLLTFLAVTLAVYSVLVNSFTSPYLEWRWLFLPLCVLSWAAGLGVDRVTCRRPALANGLFVAQAAFHVLSIVFWTSRAMRVDLATGL